MNSIFRFCRKNHYPRISRANDYSFSSWKYDDSTKKWDITYTITPQESEKILEQYSNHDRTIQVTGWMCHINQDTIDIITA